MRSNLLCSGLEVIAYNLARQQLDLQLFEFGTIYQKVGNEYIEEKKLALWLTGLVEPVNWLRQLGQVNLSSLRAIIDQLMQKVGIPPLNYQNITHSFYEYGAQAIYDDTIVATLGEIRSSIFDFFNIKQSVFFADINWKNILKLRKLQTVYLPIPKFPKVTRDLSFMVDKGVTFQLMQEVVKKYSANYIEDITLFSVYEGENIPADKKSYAITCTLQDPLKTLEHEEIDQAMNKIAQGLEHELHAIIRRQETTK